MEEQNTSSPFSVAKLAVLGGIILAIFLAWLFLNSDFVRGDDGLVEKMSLDSSDYGLLLDHFDPDKDYSSAVGHYAAPFYLEGSDGSTVDFRDYRGKNVLLVFEATWCTFCKQEIPDLNRIAEEGKVELLVVDINEKKEKVQIHLEENQINHPWYIDEGGEVSNWFFLAGTPTHLFINEEGEIVARETGYRSGAVLDAAIENLINS